MIRQDHNHFIDDEKFDNFLSKRLRQTQPYLMDENFTAQVINKLPVPKKLSALQERLIIVVPLIVISLLVVSQISLLAIAIKLWALVVSVDITSMLKLGFLVTAAVISSASFWFAKQARLI